MSLPSPVSLDVTYVEVVDGRRLRFTPGRGPQDLGAVDESMRAAITVDQVEGECPLKFAFDGSGQTVTFVEPPSNNNVATQSIVTVSALSVLR